VPPSLCSVSQRRGSKQHRQGPPGEAPAVPAAASPQGTALIHHTSFPGHKGHKEICQLPPCDTSDLIPCTQTCARSEPGRTAMPFDKDSKARRNGDGGGGGGGGPRISTRSRPCVCTGMYSFRSSGTESQSGLAWKGPYRPSCSNPLPWAGTPATSPGCSKPHPAWP